eukprot:6478014-Amphidinium_carterae.1
MDPRHEQLMLSAQRGGSHLAHRVRGARTIPLIVAAWSVPASWPSGGRNALFSNLQQHCAKMPHCS